MGATKVFGVPRSAEGVTEILRHVGLAVPDRAGYMAISQLEGSRFADALAKAVNQVLDWETALEYITNVVAGAHPIAREAAAAAGCASADAVTLISIAKKEGARFETRYVWRLIKMEGASKARRFRTCRA